MDFFGLDLGSLATSGWFLAVVAGLLIIDGFFPFVPGETLVVGLSAAIGAVGGNPWIILAVAAPASLVGDLIAYTLGRKLGRRLGYRLGRWLSDRLRRRAARLRRGRAKCLRRPNVVSAFAHTRRKLESNPASLLLTAKFLPVVRAVVPMVAGANRMPLRRYVPLTVVSVVSYTSFHVAVGAAAASWLPNPVVALAVAVVVALAFGAVIDLVVKAAGRHRASARGTRQRVAALRQAASGVEAPDVTIPVTMPARLDAVSTGVSSEIELGCTSGATARTASQLRPRRVSVSEAA